MKQPIKILHVTKSTAGVAEYVRCLANGLDHTQFSQTVVCLSENGPEFATELSQIPGVQTLSLDMKRFQIDPISDGRVACQLARTIRNGAFDLIHAHASKPGLLARLAAIGTNIPVIYSPHCFSFHAGTPAWKAYPLAAVERFAARYLTARIMTLADGEEELARRYHVGHPEQFATIHSGIDLVNFSPAANAEDLRVSLGIPVNAALVGAVGRLSQQKAPLDFVHMAALVHMQNPEVHFVWIGSGPLEAEAHQLVEDLGIEEVMHFAGQRSDVQAILPTLDCFVLPSLWEGFAIVLLEAMAAGVPVVATDIPGNDEAIRAGMDGFLVPAKHPDALASAVVEMLNNPTMADAFAISARQRVETDFTWQSMLDGIARLYRETIHEAEMGQSGTESRGRK